MSPRTKSGVERREDLLDATEALVLERGVDALTVDHITAGAGVSKGAFYLYFDSKDSVLSALRDRYVQRTMDAREEAVGRLAPDDWLGRVETWLVVGIRDYLTDPRLHDVLFLHASPPGEDGHEHRRPTVTVTSPVDRLGELLAGGAAAGAFRLPDPEATAILLYGATHSASDYLMHDERPISADRILMEARRITRRVLEVPAGA